MSPEQSDRLRTQFMNMLENIKNSSNKELLKKLKTYEKLNNFYSEIFVDFIKNQIRKRKLIKLNETISSY